MAKKKDSSSKAKAKAKPKKKSGPKGPRKRPLSDQDFEDFHKLSEMQCTLDEICGFFKCGLDTLISRVTGHYGGDFSSIYQEFRAEGKASLRRVMWDKAMKGDGFTQRWLSRQYLGMSDKVEVDDKRQTTEDQNKVLEPAERLKLIHGAAKKA